MPTPHVTDDKMGIGRKAGGKHWTAKEVAAREEAAGLVKRESPMRLRVPDWLSPEARKVWYQTLKRIAGLELLDASDGEVLAIYCDAVAKYRKLSGSVIIKDDEGQEVTMEESVKLLQAWARLIAGYADKLGLTPAARARLAKKKADEILDEFGSEFDG